MIYNDLHNYYYVYNGREGGEIFMQILFIWFQKYKKLNNFQANLGGNYSFYYDNKDTLTVKNNDIYICDFFKDSIENKNIYNLDISAIVGDNGSGKSTILDFLVELMLDDNVSDYIIIYSRHGKLYKDFRFQHNLYIDYQTKDNVNIKTKNFYNPNHLTMLFSNIFDVRYLNSGFSEDSEEFINLSTNALLSRHEKATDFMYEELQRQIFVVNKYNKRFNINHVIQLPKKIKIENKEAINSQNILTNFLEHDEIKIFNCKNLRESSGFKTKFQFNFLASYITEVKSILIDAEFVLTDQELQKIIYSSIKMAKSENNFFIILKDNLNTLATKLHLRLDFLDQIKSLSHDYLQLYNSFINLKINLNEYIKTDYRTGEDIWEGYIEIDSTLPDSKNFIDLYIEKFSHSDFLKFSWLEMSSGQFSFLTLFSRFCYAIEQISNKQKYNSYLLLIDEGDLYFHPQLQKDWLYHFIKIIDVIFNGSIQVILTTHSPFVLSDIPNTNVTFLSEEFKIGHNFIEGLDGSPRTFAANISELLSNSFFIKEGLIGKFAKERINNCIRWLLTASPSEVFEKRKQLLKFIDLIGEPILRNKVHDIYQSKLKLFETQDLVNLIELFEVKIKELKKLTNEVEDD
ncbi:hypothetical protein COM25_18135 [Bacillus wiedmannii]|uniref:Endonuclease GajA/Old nuclease/RecF-like AAA domain-containing protein n=2 Tax=Bacillus wiedmannii TaxID=1890302 RepID=A0ABD6TEW1_9BACI|nr:hypothetical protein CN630_04760 [Bacillus wiedmannii]PEO59680.1 hypothetical protein CN560_08860 [Bacillus wiedmannii]PEO94524.1 hypothetical protein CN554_21895 [Bacillus wiedmannii]PGC73719.1 hypothetical protein COM25_18135 [Bacillus wiedmannii]PHG13343.1 hypothetical protein COI74_29425 [Bacillus wiedmannii]